MIASSWFYITEIKEVYPNRYNMSKSKYPVFFKYSDSEVQLGKEFNLFKDFTIEKLGLNDRLLITGSYTLNEQNKTPQPNLGIARAINASSLFYNLKKSQIITNSELRDSNYNQDFKKGLWLNAINFRILTNDSFLKENAFGAKLYPKEGLSHPRIQAYLKYIAIENWDCQFNILEVNNSSLDSIYLHSISVKNQLLLNGINSMQINILPTIIDSTQNSYLDICINKSKFNEY